MPSASRPERLRYGPRRSQFCELFAPAGAGPFPVAVLVHGGEWRNHYGRQLMWPLARDLAARGWAAWNVEYRRVGGGGGYPETLLDVAAAVDALAERPEPLDLTHVVAIGHSAGGQLALWAAARPVLPPEAPGAGPQVRITAAVAQAGAIDLDHLGGALGDLAVHALLGGAPDAVPDRYAVASPARLLPLGVPVLLVHGEEDGLIPAEVSRRFAEAAAAAGDACTVVIAPDEGHRDHLETGSAAWATVVDWLEGQR
jgi:acetyl esterase/lipase